MSCKIKCHHTTLTFFFNIYNVTVTIRLFWKSEEITHSSVHCSGFCAHPLETLQNPYACTEALISKWRRGDFETMISFFVVNSDTYTSVCELEVVFGVPVSSLLYIILGLCEILVPKNFINTSWHRDPTWLLGLAVAPTETSSTKHWENTKASTLFIRLLPNTHTVEL